MQKAIDILKKSRSLFVLTGAGISAESGIPTFRDADGLWKNYSATDLATPDAFRKDPALVWEWYHWRQDIIRCAQPNTAHQALVAMENRMESFLLLTQNVDNLHQRAGSRNILELHGSIFRARCLNCRATYAYGIEKMPDTVSPPTCPCGGILRPDVVWFGEMIPQDIWHAALAFCATADTVLICGTSGVVWPAAALPGYAQEHGSTIIEINLEPTPASNVVDVAIKGRAGKILPALVENL
ncbi:NAD-dependent deacylase [candidate division WOR-3 bacterium]|nr:NAD-dependent deacylase [candidate division WOR-3 bacterium]